MDTGQTTPGIYRTPTLLPPQTLILVHTASVDILPLGLDCNWETELEVTLLCTFSTKFTSYRRRYQSLSFWVRADAALEKLQVWLQDEDGNKSPQPYINSITTSWQRIRSYCSVSSF